MNLSRKKGDGHRSKRDGQVATSTLQLYQSPGLWWELNVSRSSARKGLIRVRAKSRGDPLTQRAPV